MTAHLQGTMSAFMSGVMVGAFLLGKLADVVGRRTVLTLTMAGILVSNTVAGITYDFTIYVMARACVGFFCAGIQPTRPQL